MNLTDQPDTALLVQCIAKLLVVATVGGNVPQSFKDDTIAEARRLVANFAPVGAPAAQPVANSVKFGRAENLVGGQ
jgi:hypothetical protein